MPFGLLLSGGLDSSLIASIACREYKKLGNNDVQGLAATDRVFKLSQQAYRKWWYKASDALGISDLVGRPHNVRHTGPSRDIYARYRSLKEVQRRGRWRVDSSVLRYSKSHEYARALARSPPDLLAKGARLLELLGEKDNNSSVLMWNRWRC